MREAYPGDDDFVDPPGDDVLLQSQSSCAVSARSTSGGGHARLRAQRRVLEQPAQTGPQHELHRRALFILRDLAKADAPQYEDPEEEEFFGGSDSDNEDIREDLRLDMLERDEDDGANPEAGGEDYNAEADGEKQGSAQEVTGVHQAAQDPRDVIGNDVPHFILPDVEQAYRKPIELPELITGDPVTFSLAVLMIEDALSQNTVRRFIDILRLATDGKKAYTFEDVNRVSELLKTVRSAHFL